MTPPPLLRADPGDAAQLSLIVGHLEDGGLLGYPTETVYGLGAGVTAEGVRAVRRLKGRGEKKPFLILLPEEVSEAGSVLEWTPSARSLAEAVWPGRLTLVLGDPVGRFPEGVRSSAGSVAVRVSGDPFVSALMRLWKRPLLSTSANRAGRPPTRTAEAVGRTFTGGPGAGRLWIVDGGPRLEAEPSTIVDCTGARPRVLRQGALPLSRLLEVESGLTY